MVSAKKLSVYSILLALGITSSYADHEAAYAGDCTVMSRFNTAYGELLQDCWPDCITSIDSYDIIWGDWDDWYGDWSEYNDDEDSGSGSYGDYSNYGDFGYYGDYYGDYYYGEGYGDYGSYSDYGCDNDDISCRVGGIFCYGDSTCEEDIKDCSTLKECLTGVLCLG